MPADEGYGLEPAELDAIVGHLGEAGTALGKHETELAVTPDAGRSSDEVGQAFAMLATAIGGLAGTISDTSSTLSTNVSNYRAAEASAERLLDSTGVLP